MRPEDIQYNKLDQVWARYDDCAESVCRCPRSSFVRQLKQFISLLEQNEPFMDFNKIHLPQVDFEHWMQEARLHAQSFGGNNGSLFPVDQKERLALQWNTLRAVAEASVSLASFCRDLLSREHTDVDEELFIKKVFEPFAVEYKWQVKQQTRHFLHEEPSEAPRRQDVATSAKPGLQPLQDLAFIVTGYPEDDALGAALIRVIRRSCYRSNLRIICLEDVEAGDDITEQTLQFLHSACLVICDVTRDHPRLHKILDYAKTLNQTRIITAQDGTSLEAVNSPANVIRYCNLIDLESQLNRRLTDLMQANR